MHGVQAKPDAQMWGALKCSSTIRCCSDPHVCFTSTLRLAPGSTAGSETEPPSDLWGLRAGLLSWQGLPTRLWQAGSQVQEPGGMLATVARCHACCSALHASMA